MKRLLIAGALLCASFLPVRAQTPCISVDRMLAIIEQMVDQGAARHIRILEGEDRQRFLDYFNQLPPESDFSWSIVIMADLPNGAGLVAVGDNGQICEAVPFAPHIFQGFVDAVAKGKGV